MICFEDSTLTAGLKVSCIQQDPILSTSSCSQAKGFSDLFHDLYYRSHIPPVLSHALFL
jgi:hypothetical protein